MKGILKWPLVIAAVVIVARIVAEQMGAPDRLSNSLSVVILTPLVLVAIWTIASVIVGGVLGSIVIAVGRKMARNS